MKPILFILSTAALIATIVPSLFYLSGRLSKDNMQWIMLAGTIVWFAVVPFCGRRSGAQKRESC